MSTSVDADDVRHRHFIAVATSTYEDARFKRLDGLSAEVEVIKRWVCDPELGACRFTHRYERLTDSPKHEDVRSTLMNVDHPWTESHAAVLYVTGHGFVDQDSHRHWLAFSNTQYDKPNTTAIPTSTLVGSLNEIHHTPHLLAIFDLCYAGAAAPDALRFDIPDSWLVLASSGPRQTAEVGGLTSAIDEVLEYIKTDDRGQKFGLEDYLLEQQFVEEVAKRLASKSGQRVTLLQGRIPRSLPHVCLPNPRRKPREVEPQRRDLGLDPGELRLHWGPRSKGLTRDGESGWLFSGREQLMSALIAAARAEPVVTVVTGRAGCGKSAALARLVTLSDPMFRAAHADRLAEIDELLRPREGDVDVAVLGTGKVATEIFAQVLGGLGVDIPASARTSRELKQVWDKWAASNGAAVTIVLDALDESTRPQDVIAEVLQPLADSGMVRLIVGVRAPGADDPQSSAAVYGLAERVVQELHAGRLDVDQPPWWRDEDLRRFVHAVLTTTMTSPYRTAAPELTTSLVDGIAEHASSSFLIARLAATSLAARSEVIDPDDPAWRQALADGVVGVFRADLHANSSSPADLERAVHLLRAVAFAYGRGLPWYQIWPVVANAVAKHERIYGDSDIAALIGSRLGGYLVTDTEDHTTVYRLFHDALRDALRSDWEQLLRPPTSNAGDERT